MAYTFEILRPDDLLVLSVQAVNLKLDTSRRGAAQLVRVQRNAPAYLVYQCSPQSIAEQAFYETAQIASVPFNPPPSTPPLPPTPAPPTVQAPQLPGNVGQRMSAPGRLVFQLKSGQNAVDYTVEALLDWSAFDLVLPPAARVLPGADGRANGATPPPIAEPAALETALELPWRLWLAPNAMRNQTRPAWVHALEPVTYAGRTELWHTRLASARELAAAHGGRATVVTEASRDHTLPLRVVWSPDFVADGPLPSHAEDNTPFLSAMSARDRDQIVILSSGFAGYTLSAPGGATRAFVPQTINASRLFLSALGGWLALRGAWPYPVSYGYRSIFLPAATFRAKAPVTPIPLPEQTAALDLVEWDHVATQGRDHYVRIVYEGFLYPFGHRASLIKVTERKVLAPGGAEGNPSASPVAYLRQKMYIVVRERIKSYTGAPYTAQGREMPFRAQVRIDTEVTPDVDPPVWIGDASFRVQVGGQPFAFHVNARDLAGVSHDFLAPLIFVSLSEGQLGVVQSTYASQNALRNCVVNGQQIAYADPAAGDTVLKTSALYFTAQITQSTAPFTQTPFIPALDRAGVMVPALQQLINLQTAVLIQWYQGYLDAGLDPNAGVFVQVAGTPPPVAFSANQAGGFARPNLALSALSARKGVVSGNPLNAAQGTIDPAAYFGDIDARLFGTVDLGQLIPLDAITHLAGAAQNAPEIRTRAVPNRMHPKQLITVIAWSPQLQDYSTTFVSIAFNSDNQASSLNLNVRIVDALDGTPPQSNATGVLSNFTLSLVQVIELKIASISFSSTNGAKSKVVLHLANQNPIGFEGPLQFVQTLANALPSGLFGDMGPTITAGSTALRVAYTLGLPPITCGVFSLQNISILAALDLPYLDGKPAVEFGFAKRNSPFLLTVEIFGGGGFVHVVLDTSGVRMVEGALEFGGNFALNLGVASGAVHAMAGIYFQLKGQYSNLTGFVDVGGEVSVLGIISISIDLNLSLSWQSSPSGNLIEGRATLTVSVHVLFFSASVQLSVERSFSAGGGDPKVYQLMSATQWQDYALAFD